MCVRDPTPLPMALRKASPALLFAAASVVCLSFAPHGRAAGDNPPPQAPSSPANPTDQLLGPIALYPDPLLAIILPASTVPADISAASAYLVQYGDPTRLDGQPWDPSVRALAHYPAILTWMAENIEWTEALGHAFLSSPPDVMASIQRLRARAVASGALVSTPQQRVMNVGKNIEILPAQPDSIYAPAYNPDAVYADESGTGLDGPLIDYGAALPVGLWLSYCFDWGGNSIWVGGWDAWRGPGGWRYPHFGGGHGPPGTRPWHPSGHHPGSSPPNRDRHGESIPLPRPMAGAPNPPPTHTGDLRVQEGATGAAVPLPRTAAPPMDRPRLQPAYAPPPGESRANESVQVALSPAATPRAQGSVPSPGNPPSPAIAEAAAPAGHPETARDAAPRESVPPPAHESAPASHESAPAPSHDSAPVAPATPDTRNH